MFIWNPRGSCRRVPSYRAQGSWLGRCGEPLLRGVAWMSRADPHLRQNPCPKLGLPLLMAALPIAEDKC